MTSDVVITPLQDQDSAILVLETATIFTSASKYSGILLMSPRSSLSHQKELAVSKRRMNIVFSIYVYHQKQKYHSISKSKSKNQENKT